MSGIKWSWGCSTSFSEGLIKKEQQPGEMKLSFPVCQEYNLPNCKFVSKLSPLLKTELIEVGKVLYLKFLPPEGSEKEKLFEWEFQGERCIASGTWSVRGSFAGLFSPKEELEHVFEFSPAINAAAGAHLTFGSSEVEMSGSFTSALAGEHTGETWGAE